jgi:polyphosphate kinase
LNRELSWLDFDRRVLALAEDPERPLLERVKFLAIYSRNLDEFFQVRVAGLQDQVEAELGTLSPDGRSPRQQLMEIRERVLEWTQRAEAIFERELRPALDVAGVHVCSWDALSATARKQAQEQFETEIRPVLVPLSVDPTHPFPYISGLSLNIGALVQRRGGGETRLVRVKVPSFLPKLWRLEGSFFVRMEELILAHLAALFPEDEVNSAGFFRVTRDAELELRERESVDLVRDIEAGLRRRLRGSDAVRLEVDRGLDGALLETLIRGLRLEPDEAFETGFLDFGRLWEL